MQLRNCSSETIVVDEGVPIDPTDVGTCHGSIKRIPGTTIFKAAVVPLRSKGALKELSNGLDA